MSCIIVVALPYTPAKLMSDSKVCLSTFLPWKLVHREAYSAHITHMAFNAFTEDNPTFVGISERALRPLINEQNPDIKAEAKQKIRSGVTKGHPMGAVNTDLYAIALKAYC